MHSCHGYLKWTLQVIIVAFGEHIHGARRGACLVEVIQILAIGNNTLVRTNKNNNITIIITYNYYYYKKNL